MHSILKPPTPNWRIKILNLGKLVVEKVGLAEARCVKSLSPQTLTQIGSLYKLHRIRFWNRFLPVYRSALSIIEICIPSQSSNRTPTFGRISSRNLSHSVKISVALMVRAFVRIASLNSDNIVR